MKRRILTAVLLCCVCMAVNARTWLIGTGGEFVDINAAMSNSYVEDGDTLQFLPKTVLNTQQTVSKAVTIIGTGYLNPDESSLDRTNNYDAYLIIESDDVTIRSFRMGWVIIHGTNTRIEHCYVDYWVDINSFNYDTENAVITSSYIGFGIAGYNQLGVIYEYAQNWVITNNIIGPRGGTWKIIGLDGATIDHNIIYSPSKASNYMVTNVKNSTFTNNIIVCDGSRDYTFDANTQKEASNCIIRNNIISNKTDLSRFPDNKQVVNLAAVCTREGDDKTSDIYYRLLDNSPAKGYATDGGDCGPWSGARPYVVGGIPSETEPTTGNYKLDFNATDNPSAGVFQSLQSLFTTIEANGIASQTSVSVADGEYDYIISQDNYWQLPSVAKQVQGSTGTISMTAPKKATFNIKADETFLANHASEIDNITSSFFATFKEFVSLTNITVNINITPIIDEFQVEANDLLALKNMYNAWAGPNWMTKRWNFKNNGRSKDDFPGVTFDDNGRVTAIDLENNGLAGKMFPIYSPQLSELTSLNLSRNKLEGDLGIFVNGMGKMKKLNMSYNRLNSICQDLYFADNISYSINVRYQNREYLEGSPTKANFTINVDTMSAMTLKLSREMMFTVPSLFTYDFKYQQHRLSPPFCVRQMTPPALDFAKLTYNGDYYGDLGHIYTLNYNGIYTLPQDQRMVLVDEWTDDVRYSALPVIFHYEEGDADMSGETNVLDVQYTLNYILAPATVSYFNYSAANTYSDQGINVQDIVKTVNIILHEPIIVVHNSRLTGAVMGMADTMAPSDGTIAIENRQVMVNAQKELSAIDVELEGVTVDEVGLMLNQRDFQMIGRNTDWGCRFVIFSPTGMSIPTGKATALLRLSSRADLVGIQCSDPQAQEVLMTIGTTPTGIRETTRERTADDATYDLNGRRVTDDIPTTKGVYVRQGQKLIVR